MIAHSPPGVNGTVRKRAHPRAGAPGGAVAASGAAPQPIGLAAHRARLWARYCTAGSIGLSAWLNARAAIHESGATSWGAIEPGCIGVAVPLLVWGLFTLSSWTYRAGRARLALVNLLIGACVLALSVYHVAGALSLVTGWGWQLCALLAIGIDCGLVSSEATAILVSEEV